MQSEQILFVWAFSDLLDLQGRLEATIMNYVALSSKFYTAIDLRMYDLLMRVQDKRSGMCQPH